VTNSDLPEHKLQRRGGYTDVNTAYALATGFAAAALVPEQHYIYRTHDGGKI
jgi:hypothetical protein